MKTKYLLTIGIPNYNYGKYISETIVPLLEQLTSDIEIIVSDNFSSDNSWEIIQLFSMKNVKTILQTKNLGMHGNWNFLLSEAQGEYFMLLPSDDIVGSAFLKSIHEPLLIAKEKMASAIVWGYSNIKGSIIEDTPLPKDRGLETINIPNRDNNVIEAAYFYSQPWGHALNTCIARNIKYDINSSRPDSKLFLETVCKDLSKPIVSINCQITSQRIHDTNIRKRSEFISLFNDNLFIYNKLKNCCRESFKLRIWINYQISQALLIGMFYSFLKEKKAARNELMQIFKRNSLYVKAIIWLPVFIVLYLRLKVFKSKKVKQLISYA